MRGVRAAGFCASLSILLPFPQEDLILTTRATKHRGCRENFLKELGALAGLCESPETGVQLTNEPLRLEHTRGQFVGTCCAWKPGWNVMRQGLAAVQRVQPSSRAPVLRLTQTQEGQRQGMFARQIDFLHSSLCPARVESKEHT